MTSLDYIFITFENAPVDEDTVRHGLDLLFPLHEVFKNVTTGHNSIWLRMSPLSQGYQYPIPIPRARFLFPGFVS